MDADQAQEAMAAEKPAAASEAEDGSHNEFSLAELTEWATEEKLAACFKGHLEHISRFPLKRGFSASARPHRSETRNTT